MEDARHLKVGGLTVRIDRTLCVGFEDCVAEAPEAFALDEEGIVDFTAGAATTARERLMEACDACPVDALSVYDEDGTRLIP